MKSERSSNHKRKLMIVVMLLSIMVCFTQKVWVTRKATVDEFPGGILTGYFNADGGVNFYTIDTAYCNDMTFLLGKKTLHPFIIVDIDKAKLSHDVTEKELMNSPYCYLSIATTGRIYFDDFVRATFPWGKVVGDTLIDYETLSLGEWMYKKNWKLYKPIAFFLYLDFESPYKNFYVVPFNPPTNKAVLGLAKAKLINKFTGTVVFTSYIITDTTKPVTIPEDEYIKPYKFENNEAFYKVLFPYADK